MTLEEFQNELRQGIPNPLPEPQPYDPTVNHAPKRKDILTPAEKKLAIRNALRYFDPKDHAMLAPEFAEELKKYGRIYMYRLRPTYKMYARPIDEYPAKCRQAAAIMLMIQNNLDPAVAQHPHELITYGGNGAVFQNWAQYRLVMKYLSEMTDEQTLVMYSGHPMGLYPSHKDAPRVVVTNGMMIPNYSKPDDWERYNALGVTQYGQMTAGSYMYIGPQGIVHGTTITVLNAARKLGGGTAGKLFITAGLGGMSGAQPKAGDIAGVVSITAEINPAATQKRYDQGWVDEVHADLDELFVAVNKARAEKIARSFAYQGNVVDLWEYCAEKGIQVSLTGGEWNAIELLVQDYLDRGANMLQMWQIKYVSKVVNQGAPGAVDGFENGNGTETFIVGNVYLVTPSENTGIETIQAEVNANQPMYNVLGQRVNENYKGIVIQNGHKYIIK